MNFMEKSRKAVKYTHKTELENEEPCQENLNTSVFDMIWMPRKLYGI